MYSTCFVFTVANLSILRLWLYQQALILLGMLCCHICPTHIQIFSLYAHFMCHAQINRWKHVCLHSFKDHYIIEDYKRCTKSEKKKKKVIETIPLILQWGPSFILFLVLTSPSSQGPAHTQMNASMPTKETCFNSFSLLLSVISHSILLLLH